jgi:hypothetical protein
LVTRHLPPGLATETTGSPKFLGNLDCPSAHALRLRRDDPFQTLRDEREALGRGTAKAPARNRLSKLNDMAFRLAVYASWGRLPGHHARLASRCWLTVDINDLPSYSDPKAEDAGDDLLDGENGEHHDGTPL